MQQDNEQPNTQTLRPPGEARTSAPSHDFPRSSEKSPWGSRLIIAAVCILVVLGVFWLIHQRHAAAQKQGASARGTPPPVPVVAGKVAQKDIPIYLDGLGTVQAFNTVTIRARVDGQLQKVAFTEGQDVHTDDVLAQIDPEPLKTQLAQAIAKKGQDVAQLANAQADLRRNADLLANKIVSQSVYDTAKALADQFDASVKADEAAIASVQVQLGYTTITSPIDGRTGIRQVDQGNVVHATDPSGLVIITQLRPITVTFTLPEQTLNQIHREMSAGDLAVLAVDRDNSTVLSEGKLAVIDNQIDTATGTIKLKATFPNTDLHLWPGQFVNARLLVTTHKNGLVVPASVIQRGPDGAYAFVIKEDLSVEMRTVRVAQIEGGQALLEEEQDPKIGLHPGERVVVDGQYKLQSGSHVKLSPPAKPETRASAP